MEIIHGQLAMLNMLPITEMIKEGETVAAVGPLLNPTLYMKNGKKLDEDLIVLHAAFTYLQTVKAAMR